jgi:hypothetical protein
MVYINSLWHSIWSTHTPYIVRRWALVSSTHVRGVCYDKVLSYMHKCTCILSHLQIMAAAFFALCVRLCRIWIWLAQAEMDLRTWSQQPVRPSAQETMCAEWKDIRTWSHLSVRPSAQETMCAEMELRTWSQLSVRPSAQETMCAESKYICTWSQLSVRPSAQETMCTEFKYRRTWSHLSVRLSA